MTNPKTLTLSGVALYLGYSRRSIYNMLEDKRFSVPSIPGVHPRRWNVEDVDAWRLANTGNGDA